jgi:uncharacterized protein (TIGR02145 family)
VSTLSCVSPAVPAAITFSPAFGGGDIVQNTLVKATASLAEGAKSYTWSVPAGMEIVGDATGRIISIRVVDAKLYNGSDITVSATNECYSSDPKAGSGTINVTACTTGPAMPTLIVPSVRINPGETVTISCSDVGATEYHWTLPTGVTALSTTTTTNSIEVTVNDEGYYYGNDFSVYAETSCGTSGVRTGTNGAIIAQICTEAPSNPLAPTLNNTYVSGSTFYIPVSVVTKGVTTYEWSLPTGLSIVSGDNTSAITVEATTVGNYNASDIKVKVTNACGSLTVAASGTVTVIAPGTPSTDIVGAEGASYTTFKYPLGLGTWMTTNSKEEPASRKSSAGHADGERGYYYNINDSKTACPSGFQLPTPQQFDALWSYLSAKTDVTDENEPWISENAAAGAVNPSNGNNTVWGKRLSLSADVSSTNLYYYINADGTYHSGTPTNYTGYSVRCIKSTCDEAPYIASVSTLGTNIPIGVPVKVYVTARSAGAPTYQWSVPAGAEIVSGATTDTLVVQFNSQVSFDGSQLFVTVSNDCGSTKRAYNGTFSVTADLGQVGDPLVGVNGTYATYEFPAGIGTWMADWSKEGNPKYKQYGEYGVGERGYYYLHDELDQACPAGWRVPNLSEVEELVGFHRNLPESSPLKALMTDPRGGSVNGDAPGSYWDTNSYYLAVTGYYGINVSNWYIRYDFEWPTTAVTARCIKNE